MPEFLHLLPPLEALSLLLQNLPACVPGVEVVPAAQALGRVTAREIVSPEPLPAFARSTVDGYACRARDTFGAGESLPAYLRLTGEVPMGRAAAFHLAQGQAALIHTGGMLPDRADAVVMLEYTQPSRGDEIEILRSVAPGDNVLQPGEDIQSGQVVLPRGALLGPAEIGGLMALGLVEIEVARTPRVGILSSGDEVVPPEVRPGAGQVRDVNSYTLAALAQSWGGLPCRYGILPDSAAELDAALRVALSECDLIVVTAGSSASTRDLTADCIDRLGKPGVLVHGVNVKPGKPTILGVCEGKPVVGLPGNPVSALVIARIFVVPLIERLLGLPSGPAGLRVFARLAASLPSQAGREDYVPVRLVSGAQGLTAEPVYYKSNLIFSLSRADGLALIPADANGMAAGDLVEVELMENVRLSA